MAYKSVHPVKYEPFSIKQFIEIQRWLTIMNASFKTDFGLLFLELPADNLVSEVGQKGNSFKHLL